MMSGFGIKVDKKYVVSVENSNWVWVELDHSVLSDDRDFDGHGTSFGAPTISLRVWRSELHEKEGKSESVTDRMGFERPEPITDSLACEVFFTRSMSILALLTYVWSKRQNHFTHALY